MTRPRYLRARQSHCVYTQDWHFYAFPWAGAASKRQFGVSVKHRRRDGRWRHYTARLIVRREDAVIIHAEVVTHLSEDWSHGRVPRSKRYLRMKVCI